MNAEICHKWCKCCRVVPALLSAQFCHDCGGSLSENGDPRVITLNLILPSADSDDSNTPDRLTSAEVTEVTRWMRRNKKLVLTLEISGDETKLVSLHLNPKGD